MCSCMLAQRYMLNTDSILAHLGTCSQSLISGDFPEQPAAGTQGPKIHNVEVLQHDAPEQLRAALHQLQQNREALAWLQQEGDMRASTV